MAVYFAPDNSEKQRDDWATAGSMFLGIGDLLNKKKRLAYEMGDYQGGNPQFSGQPGSLTQQLADIQKADTSPMAQGRIQFAGQTAPGGGILDVVDGKAQLTDAGYAAPTGMGALGGSGPVPGAVTNKYLNALGNQAEKMFLADNAAAQGANKVQLTDQGFAAPTGMSKEKVGAVSKGYTERVGDEAIKQFLADDQARSGNKQEKMATAANNIRQSLAEGYRYKGPDIRAARQILMNDALATADMQRRRGDIAGYQSTVAQLYVDMQNADYGVHKDHKIKADNLLQFLAATAPRPSGGGPGLKPYEVIIGSGSRARKVTVDASSLADAMRKAPAEGVRVYGGVLSDWIGKTAQQMGSTTGTRGEKFDPNAYNSIYLSEGPAAAQRYREDVDSVADRRTMGGGSPTVTIDPNAMGGYGYGINMRPPVDVQSAATETPEEKKRRILEGMGK